jgi:hypothetical protein
MIKMTVYPPGPADVIFSSPDLPLAGVELPAYRLTRPCAVLLERYTPQPGEELPAEGPGVFFIDHKLYLIKS